MNEKSLIRVFVAMPGTNMGESASWQNIDEIKMFFYEALGDKLQQVLQCQVHASMFKEAWDADVYIADLTGNNPNVYLELGVRWAVKDKVTVIVSQDVSSIKFNAASNRAIP